MTNIGERTLTHGHTRRGQKHNSTPTYRAWQRMIQRCTNSNTRNWDRYGGRGIKVCDRWLGPTGFVNFLTDMGAMPEGRPRQWSLDRIFNDGNYEPNNCRWTTAKVQIRNSSLVHHVMYGGENLPLADWNARLGLSKAAIFLKARKLGSYEAAVAWFHQNHKKTAEGRMIEIDGVVKSFGAWAATIRMSKRGLHQRQQRLSIPMEDAIRMGGNLRRRSSMEGMDRGC